jgi:glycine/serine hydroxymethyltransferase
LLGQYCLKVVTMFDKLNHLGDLARDLIKRTIDNTVWRQKMTVNLIPSEQTPSPLVRLLCTTDPSGRYAEHQIVDALGEVENYYYQGTRFIADVEAMLIAQIKSYIGCSLVETRPISGQMANTAVYSGMLAYLNRFSKRLKPRRFSYVMNHHIASGGHLSSQALGALRDYVALDHITERPAIVHFQYEQDNPWQIDVVNTAQLVSDYKPDLLILGKSAILNREPVKEIAHLISDIKPKPIIMYDAAHVFGLLGPYFQQPLMDGADILTASTHKTFFGTQRGLIASNMDNELAIYELWENIVRRVFPGSVSNHHLGTLLGLLMATYEMNIFKEEYQRQVITNAKAFASALKECGFMVEGNPQNDYTETHQVIIRLSHARGIKAARKLEDNNVIVNYQRLMDDESFTAASGIRMGVQEMSRFGMRESDFQELAHYLSDILLCGKDIPQVIMKFRSRFTKMKYCLDEKQARPLIEAIVDCL